VLGVFAPSLPRYASRQTGQIVTETYDPRRTAILLVDPYNDFISEGGIVRMPKRAEDHPAAHPGCQWQPRHHGADDHSYILQQHIPGAQLIIYPDSGHGSHFQYSKLFVNHVSRFLDSERAFG
jgi:pimeloyl-ACP methyl ester carboxylesterase